MAGRPVADTGDVGRGTASVVARARVTGGADMWTTNADAVLELPVLRLSDGPSGVRGPLWDERTTARCAPCGTALAATWDIDLLARVGRLIGDEARRQDVHVVLGPTLNIHRSPLGGRGFECYSEDPLLSGRMAAAWIDGVQSGGVAACPKHFVANDSETSRTRIDCVVDERALREIYLVPFEHAVRGGAWALMAAYNRVNGVYATEHEALIRDIVKGEWRWDGLVVSDWFAAHDTVTCALAGLDLEMPGPARVFGKALAQAVLDGLVPQTELDDKVERLRRLARRVTRAPARLARPSDSDARDGISSSVDDLLTEAAAGGFVLLKNARGMLPLLPGDSGLRLAVIGPNAVRPCYQGSGSAEVNMGATRSLVTALEDRFGRPAVVRAEPGCSSNASFRGLHQLSVRAVGEPGRLGLTVQYFADEHSETPTWREVRNASRLVWGEGVPGMGAAGQGSIRVSTVFEPEVDGGYAFSVRGSGATRLLVGGEEVASLTEQARREDPLAAWFSEEWGEGAVELRAHAPVLVQIEMQHRPADDGIAIMEYGCRPPEPAGILQRAVTLANEADAVVLVVGTDQGVESESTDRTTTALPGAQDVLVRSVLAANPDTVVVVNAGAAVDMPWAEDAATIMYCWFPGEAFADALAAVVAGDLEPGGRLPLTLAADARQYPAYETTPDATGALRYTESVFVGYRHFDASGQVPAFGFGHGLGYTDFGYDSLTLSSARMRAGEELTARVVLRNAGARPGKEVVQLYVSPPPGPLPRPPRELKAFAVVRIPPGESAEVTLPLDARAFAHWDTEGRRWRVQSGRFGIHVGRSSRDLRLTAGVDITT